MSVFRHQLPVYSPVSVRGICSAAGGAALRRAGSSAARMLERAYGADRAVLCGSGTQALQLAIQLAERGSAEPIVAALPAYTCFDVGSAAVGADVPVRLYDIDPSTLSPDLDSLGAVLDEGANLVVVSPLYGVPVDWEAVERCTAPYDVLVIEDAAQGHGAFWRDRPLGSLGSVSVLSFGRGKGWTGVRGGALLLRGSLASGVEPVVAEPAGAAELETIVSAAAQWTLGRPGLYALPASIPWLGLGETVYKEPKPVTAMAQSAAALVLQSQPAAETEAAARRSNAASLLNDLPVGRGIQTIRVQPAATPGYLRLPLSLARGLAGFARPAEAVRLGIAPGYPTTLAEVAAVRERMGDVRSAWPGGEELCRKLVTLPTHTRLSAADRAKVLRQLDTYGG